VFLPAVNVENRPLVTDELVEFEGSPVKSSRFWEKYPIGFEESREYASDIMKQYRKFTRCDRLDLETIDPCIIPKNFGRRCLLLK
jgi:hypothetical protein